MTGNPAYGCWENMIQRCTNPNASKYDLYGGRGITVCSEWRNFSNFIKDLGERPSRKHTLERIDPDRGYEPGNVRWATYNQQNLNRRDASGTSTLMRVEKHRRKWRFRFEGKRYSFDTYEQALEAKLGYYNNSGGW